MEVAIPGMVLAERLAVKLERSAMDLIDFTDDILERFGYCYMASNSTGPKHSAAVFVRHSVQKEVSTAVVHLVEARKLLEQYLEYDD